MDLWYRKGGKGTKGLWKDTVVGSFAMKLLGMTVENGRKVLLGDKQPAAAASELSVKNAEGAPQREPAFLNQTEPRPLQTNARSVPPKLEDKTPEVYIDELGRMHGNMEPRVRYCNARPSMEDFDLPEESLDLLNDSLEDENDPLKDESVRDLQEAMADIDFLATEEGFREFQRAMIDPTVLLSRNITEEEEDLLASFDVLVIDSDFPDVTFVYDKHKGKMVYCE
ncbi:uncharacterized protein LOC135195682 [Macrobrachium nipponense]|uniref:uncharacterized protein LOC135195682 n=1 Tax=Macrobrachium nipponense TaxID=159736 RepID=UPI0030C8952B